MSTNRSTRCIIIDKENKRGKILQLQKELVNMDFDTQQAFALIMSELKEIKTEMRQDISEIKNNMATKEQVATKEQLASVMGAINATNNNLSNKMDKLSEKDRELENVARRNAYNIALLQGKAQ